MELDNEGIIQLYINDKILLINSESSATFAKSRASFTASTVSSGLMSPTEISFKTFLVTTKTST